MCGASLPVLPLSACHTIGWVHGEAAGRRGLWQGQRCNQPAWGKTSCHGDMLSNSDAFRLYGALPTCSQITCLATHGLFSHDNLHKERLSLPALLVWLLMCTAPKDGLLMRSSACDESSRELRRSMCPLQALSANPGMNNVDNTVTLRHRQSIESSPRSSHQLSTRPKGRSINKLPQRDRNSLLHGSKDPIELHVRAGPAAQVRQNKLLFIQVACHVCKLCLSTQQT